MPMQKKSSSHEFSKLILIAAGILDLYVIIFSSVMIWRTNDLTPLPYLISSAAAEVATGTAFYYNKAKAENRLKLMKIYGIEVNEKNFDGGGGVNYDRPDIDSFGGGSLGSGDSDGVSDSAYQAQG